MGLSHTHPLPSGSCLGLFQPPVSLNLVPSADSFSKNLPNTIRRGATGLRNGEAVFVAAVASGPEHNLKGFLLLTTHLSQVAAAFSWGKSWDHNYRG